MNQIVSAEKLGSKVAMTGSDGGFAVTPQTLSDIVEFARFMCQSNAGIPAFLRGNGPDCAAVTMQAMKWGFDPFSVAQKSYKVKDIIAYEAQLIAAVINARSGIKGRLKYHFEGSGNDLRCTVSGELDGEVCEYTSPPVGSITTKNSPLWKTDPEQQLGYYSARNWARRHCPEVILGAYDREEAEEFRASGATDVTPTVLGRLQAGQSEGFNSQFVTDQTESFGSTHNQSQEPSDTPPSGEVDGTPSVDTGGGEADSRAAPADSAQEAEITEAGENTGRVTTKQTAPVSGGNRAECIDKMLTLAVDDRVNEEDRIQALAERADDWADDVGRDFATAVYKTARQVIRGEVTVPEAKKYLEAVR